MPPEAASQPELLPLGQDGVLVRFALRPSPQATAAVQSFRRALADADLPGVTQIASALASLLVRFDPAAVARADLASQLSRMLSTRDWRAAPLPPARRRWTIPVSFGGAFGPQLAEAADLAGLSSEAAVAEIAAAEIRVLAIGFAPGQPYLGFLPERWDFARQPQLTPHVPAGAVVVAVRQIVLFAADSATGWRQVGQSAFRPFMPDRAEPFVLRPGDAVRLARIPDGELRDLLAGTTDGLGGARCEVLS